MKKIIPLLLILFLFSVPSYAGRFCQVHTLYSSAVLDSSDTATSSLDVSEYIEGIILINLTAETGTATLAMTLQISPDNSTWFTAAESFTNMTAIGKQVVKITNFGKYIKVGTTVTGTGSWFTGSITFIGKD